MLENKITQLTDKDREHLKSKSPAVLPDNPSGKGWTANQIKIKFYEGLLLLFEWLKKSQTETNNLLVLIEENANQTVSKTVNKIINGETTVKKAFQDEDGNNIKATYSTKIELLNLITMLKSGEQAILNYIKEDGSERAIYLIENELNKMILNLQNGATTVNKALKDGYGNIIADTYVNNTKIASSKTSADTTQLVTLAIAKELVNDLSIMLTNGSVESLNTLKELGEALGNDPNFATTITRLIGEKLSIEEATKTYLTKSAASNTYSTKEEMKAVEEKIDNFVGIWEEVPKVSSLGDGRYSIAFEEWIGDLGDGRYSLPLNS